MRCIRIDLSKIFPMEPSKFKNSISVESYDEKTAENYRNCYVAEKHIFSKPFFIAKRLGKRLCQNLTSLSLMLSKT